MPFENKSSILYSFFSSKKEKKKRKKKNSTIPLVRYTLYSANKVLK